MQMMHQNPLHSDLKKVLGELQSVRKNEVFLLKLDEILLSHSFEFQHLFHGKSLDVLDVVVHSPGGSIEAAYNFVKIARTHCKKINGIVPLYAKSAATLICMGMDEFVLGEIGELGPLDSQVQELEQGDGRTFKSSLNSFKALEQIQKYSLETLDLAVKLILRRSGMKISEGISLATEFASIVANPLFSQINPYKLGEHARELEVGKRYAKRVLCRFMRWEEDLAERVSDVLVRGFPSHGYILDLDDLRGLNLPVRAPNDVERDVIEKMKLPLLHQQGDWIGFYEKGETTDGPKVGTNLRENPEA